MTRSSFRRPAPISSLRKRLADCESILDQIDASNALSFNLRFVDFDEATQIAKDALVNAQTERYELGVADSLCNLSWFNTDRTNYREAHNQAMEALAIYEKFDLLWGRAAILDRTP